jgi:hypothetical protein
MLFDNVFLAHRRPVVVPHDKAGIIEFFDRPGRREAVGGACHLRAILFGSYALTEKGGHLDVRLASED